MAAVIAVLLGLFTCDIADGQASPVSKCHPGSGSDVMRDLGRRMSYHSTCDRYENFRVDVCCRVERVVPWET